MTNYATEIQEVVQIAIDLAEEGSYNSPDEAILAMLDGDEQRDTRLND